MGVHHVQVNVLVVVLQDVHHVQEHVQEHVVHHVLDHVQVVVHHVQDAEVHVPVAVQVVAISEIKLQ